MLRNIYKFIGALALVGVLLRILDESYWDVAMGLSVAPAFFLGPLTIHGLFFIGLSCGVGSLRFLNTGELDWAIFFFCLAGAALLLRHVRKKEGKNTSP